jgi:hypothetical protein
MKVKRVVVHCGECGHDFGLELMVDPELTPSLGDLRQLIREALGVAEAVTCPRCASILYASSAMVAASEPERFGRAAQATVQARARRIRGVRFAVGSPDGPRAAVWRVWLNKRRDDVYIAARGLAGTLKVSLHPTGWRLAFTKSFAESGSPLVPPGGRAIDTWDRPPEFAPGWTRAFEIIVPSSEVVEPVMRYETGEEVVWLSPPSPGEATHFNVVLSKPGAARGPRWGFPTADGQQGRTELVTVLDLSSGERVWVVAHDEPVKEDERVAVARIREVAREHADELLASYAWANVRFDPRAIVFGDMSDGSRACLDVSLATLRDS